MRNAVFATCVGCIIGAAGVAFAADNGAHAVLSPASGSDVRGTIRFAPSANGEGVDVEGEVTGLTPHAAHGFHVHEHGDCSAPDATSAGGHFNPHGMPHGGLHDDQRHEGDLGNIQANGAGVGIIRLKSLPLSFEGDSSIIGRAVIVHAQPDDFRSQPTGNAGARLACGVIGSGSGMVREATGTGASEVSKEAASAHAADHHHQHDHGDHHHEGHHH